MREPIAVPTVRYRCPSCSRSHSTKSRARRHIARCWYNPDAAGCRTCKHFDPGTPAESDVGYPGTDEACSLGVSLEGRPECERCNGEGRVWIGDWDSGNSVTCPGCQGRPDAVKPGPIVHCSLWESSPEYATTKPKD